MYKLSIIIPFYNSDNYITKCIYSILKFRSFLDDFEIILINDGSKDRSLDIVKKTINKYPNIKLINQTNMGLSYSRNVGIDIAQGKYLWFVDSDDYVTEGSINTILTLIDRKPNSTLFVSPLNKIYESQKKNNSQTEKNYPYDENLMNGKDILFRYFLGGPAQRFIINKQHLYNLDLKFIVGIYHEDLDFCYRLLYLTKDVVIIKKPLYNYLIRAEGSITSNWKIKNTNDLIYVYERLRKFSNNITDKNEKTKFIVKINNILFNSIRIAKGHWDDRDFIKLIRKRNKLFRDAALFNIINEKKTYKTIVKNLLIFFDPIIFYKIKMRNKF